MDQTQSLSTLLSRNFARSGSVPIDATDGCARCGHMADMGHSCCECRDGRFVSLGFDWQTRTTARVRCPGCNGGGGAGTAGAVDEAEFMRRSRLPRMFATASFDSWSVKLHGSIKPLDMARSWAADWPPSKTTLLLTGNIGNGKTHLACAVLRELWQRHGIVGAVWNMVDLLERYKATFDDERAMETAYDIDQSLGRVPVLVLDDFGAQQDTAWSRRLSYGVINHRWQEGKPMVITTNAGLTDDRALSRMADVERSVIVQFAGPDVRMMARGGVA